MRSDVRGLNFMYVLPMSPQRALIEDTWFTPPTTGLPDARAAIASYLRDHFGVTRHRVLREEQGCLPMGAQSHGRAVPSRVLRLGLAAGDIRVATGYAYDAIQRRVASMLDTLDLALTTGMPVTAPAPAFSTFVRWMDDVFMRAAHRRPDQLATWMAGLFERVPIARLQRFLHDGGSAVDRAAVIAALPPPPFLRALLESAGSQPMSAWAR
jgi:lycopene beta-cyclase